MNCRRIPNSNLGVKFSEEIKAKFRQRRASEETRKRLSDSHKGQKPSQKNVEARLASITGKPVPQEVRDKISAKHKVKIVSKETRTRISEAARRAWAIKKGLIDTQDSRDAC